MKKKNQMKIALWLLTISNTIAIIVAFIVVVVDRNYTVIHHVVEGVDMPLVTHEKLGWTNVLPPDIFDTTGVVYSSGDPMRFKIGVTYADEPAPLPPPSKMGAWMNDPTDTIVGWSVGSDSKNVQDHAGVWWTTTRTEYQCGFVVNHDSIAPPKRCPIHNPKQ
jgi:hypothetical protein